MRLVSFDALRVLGFPHTTVLKPGAWLKDVEAIRAADCVLFPEYWQVPGIAFTLGKRIFPSLPTYLVGHSKTEMTRALQLLIPRHLPDTRIVANTPEQAESVAQEMVWPFVAKLPKSSMGEGVWLIETAADWRRYLERTDVIYAQEYLPIDRDLRVVWVGRQVLNAYWRVRDDGGFHNNVSRGGRVLPGMVPPAALELVEHVALTLGIDHAGFDIAMVGHHPYLLEFNRLFGTRGVDATQLRIAILDHLRTLVEPGNPDHPRPVLPVAV